MLRTLTHYRAIHLAVVAAAAVTTAVLTGALVVGDSVRGSLRAMTLDRLGEIDRVVATDRMVREVVADDVPGAVPAIVARGAATHADSGARSAGVSVLGIDGRFDSLYPEFAALDLTRPEGQVFPPVILNRSLADDLGAEVGDAVVVTLGTFSDIPRDTLMGEASTDAVVASLRLGVVDIVPDRGPGRFDLTSSQERPRNAFVPLSRMQRTLDARGRVNALMFPVGADAERLADAVELEDLGLALPEREERFAVESDEFVLRSSVERAVSEAAAAVDAPAARLRSYLANDLRVGDRATPYSLISGVAPAELDALGAPLALEDGTPVDALADDEMLLGRWLADDLGAGAGDVVRVTYWVVGPREQLTEHSTDFRVVGVARDDGLVADRHHAPEYPGLSEADDIVDWDPPFPVDLGRIRVKDEDYWDRFGATPKALVSGATAERLWGTRYGSTTSVRVGTAPGRDRDAKRASFAAALRDALDLAEFGLVPRAVRAEGLAASAGATDFAGLFLAFSMFLIVAAAMLVGLLFGLGVERRARELGVLLATGFRVATVRRRLLSEGLALGSVGAVVGAVGGVAYGWLMLTALRTLWIGAVGSSDLTLHTRPASLVGGALGSLVVIALAIVSSVVRLSKIAPPRLLAGVTRDAAEERAGRVSAVVAYGGVGGAVALAGWGIASGGLASPAIAFGVGTLALAGGLGSFARWCRGGRGRGGGLRPGGAATLRMAARNGRWNPGRSLLSVALVACAAFVIVAVAASRRHLGDELRQKDSGTGGYAVLAELDVPLFLDPGNPAAREELGFDDEASAALLGATTYPLRVLPGDDASCLNLYRPEKPRVVGLPADVLTRGGFTFKAAEPVPEGTSAWTLLERPVELDADGVPVIPAVADANSAQWILKVGLGDTVEVPGAGAGNVRLRLVGLLETSIFQSELLISEPAFLEHFPDRAGYGAMLVEAPFDRAVDVARALESSLGDYGLDAVGTVDRIEEFLEVEHTYLSTFQLLGGLGLVLGTVGLGLVMVRNILDRRRELATLRAIGWRRVRLVRLVLAENAFLLGVGLVLGGGAALLSAAPRLAAVDVAWGSLALVLVGVVATGMAAGAVAVIQALRAPLIPELRSE